MTSSPPPSTDWQAALAPLRPPPRGRLLRPQGPSRRNLAPRPHPLAPHQVHLPLDPRRPPLRRRQRHTTPSPTSPSAASTPPPSPRPTSAVQKILDFENAGQTLAGKATLVADNPDHAGDFEANQDEIATLLPSRTVEKLFLTQLGATATKAAVRNAFDSGLSLMSYVGHGSSGLWASEGILRSPDVASFAPQPTPSPSSSP